LLLGSQVIAEKKDSGELRRKEIREDELNKIELASSVTVSSSNPY
jgi:hypothetical protein